MSNNEAADLILYHISWLLRFATPPRKNGKSGKFLYLINALHRAIDILRVTPDKEDLNE